MKLTVRRIGNSLGVIVPRETLRRWGVGEGDALELTTESIRPRRRRGNRQEELDRFKRAIAIELLKRFRLEAIREASLRNLERWKSAGSWNPAYESWRELLRDGSDADVLAAMVGEDDRANEMRQSMPFVGLLPEDVRSRLLEEATG